MFIISKQFQRSTITDGTSMVKSAEGATKLLHTLRRSIEQMSASSAAAVDADDLTAQNNKLRNLLSVKRCVPDLNCLPWREFSEFTLTLSCIQEVRKFYKK